MSNPLWPHGLYSPWNSPGQNMDTSSLSLLWGILWTQKSNQGLLHCSRFFTNWAIREALSLMLLLKTVKCPEHKESSPFLAPWEGTCCSILEIWTQDRLIDHLVFWPAYVDLPTDVPKSCPSTQGSPGLSLGTRHPSRSRLAHLPLTCLSHQSRGQEMFAGQEPINMFSCVSNMVSVAALQLCM